MDVIDVDKDQIKQISNKDLYKLPHMNESWKMKREILLNISKLYKKHDDQMEQQNVHDITIYLNQIFNHKQQQDMFIYLKSQYNQYQFLVDELIPWMAKKALEIEQMKPFPILIKQQQQTITLNKNEVLILLANMFFCTISEQNSQYDLHPNYNMKYILQYCKLNYQKLICIFEYFTRLYHECNENQENINKQQLTFVRVQYDEKKFQINDQNYLKQIYLNQNITIEETKFIEDHGTAFHLDFANEYIGGGALTYGCVQEEILFAVSPELFSSMLFCEKMEQNEAIIIVGAQRYCEYQGYASKFKFKCPFICPLPFDSQNRKQIAHIVIDALIFNDFNSFYQYNLTNVKRELVKAITGFQAQNICEEQNQKFQIITGNWGCGAFNGDPQLKLIIQWMACSIVGRDMVYCVYKNYKLNACKAIIEGLKKKNIQEVFEIINNYYKLNKKQDFFSFLYKHLNIPDIKEEGCEEETKK